MQEYVFILILLLLGAAFVAVSVGAHFLLGIRPRKTPVKQEPFECGSKIFHQIDDRIFQIKYANLAILFVMFDLETILLYPWAVSARELGPGTIAIGGVFLFLLTLALVYIWRKGLLHWN